MRSRRDRAMSGPMQAFVATMLFIVLFFVAILGFPMKFDYFWGFIWGWGLTAWFWIVSGPLSTVFIWGFVVVGLLVMVGGAYLALEALYKRWKAEPEREASSANYRVDRELR